MSDYSSDKLPRWTDNEVNMIVINDDQLETRIPDW